VSLLKINSFHSEICPSVLLSKINPFLFGVWPSVFLKYQLLPFLGFARLYFARYQLLPLWGLPVCTSPNINSFLFGWDCAVLLCTSASQSHVPSATPLGGMYSANRGRDISGHYTYWALYVVLEKRWKAGTPMTGPQRMCLILGLGWSRLFLSYWAGMYPTIHQQNIIF